MLARFELLRVGEAAAVLADIGDRLLGRCEALVRAEHGHVALMQGRGERLGILDDLRHERLAIGDGLGGRERKRCDAVHLMGRCPDWEHGRRHGYGEVGIVPHDDAGLGT